MRLINCARCSRLLSMPVSLGATHTCQTCELSELSQEEHKNACSQCGETLLRSEKKWCSHCANNIAKQFISVRQ